MKTQSCTGAVCFIDLLGFSYLTGLLDNQDLYINEKVEKPFGEKKVKELTLNDLRNLDDYIKNGDEVSEDTITISDLAYNIVDTNLKRFHEIVEMQCAFFQNAEYCAISDSLFIVDESSDELLYILSNVFRECIKSGILLRAGLAYGSYYIVRTHVSNFNVYGATVTKAVNYEKMGKGCRIFTDSDFPASCGAFSEINPQLFYPYKNYHDYSVLDCFEWLMIKDSYVLTPSDVTNLGTFHNPLTVKNAVDLFYDNIEVYCNLCCSPKFDWNRKNTAGLTQLGASIEYVSSMIDKCYELSSLVNIPKEFQEKIEDGQDYAKDFCRSDAIVQEMIEAKKANFNTLFGI